MKLSIKQEMNSNEGDRPKRIPCPEGVHKGVCVDVEDMGWINGKFGWKGFIKLYFEAMVEDEDGNEKALLVKTRRTNAVISGGSRKSNLYTLLEGWIGDGFANEQEFDFSSLIGKPATLIVEEDSFINDKKEEINYAFVSVVKKCKGKVEPSGLWTALTERDDYIKPAYSAVGEGPPEAIAEREEKRLEAQAKREAKNTEPAKKEDGDDVPF